MDQETIHIYGRFRWNAEKDIKLREEKWIGFMDLIMAIDNWSLLDTQRNTSQNHLDQEIFLISFDNHIFVIPFVYEPESDTFFLKTLFPSRKYTKSLLNK